MSKSFKHRRYTRRQALIIGGAAGAAIAAALAGGYSIRQIFEQSSLPKQTVHTDSQPPTSAIGRENLLPGTRLWELSTNNTMFIQGYAGKVSALPGETVPLYISSMKPTRYTLEVFRTGWYGGLGARLLHSRNLLPCKAQGYWTPKTGLVNCPTRSFDPQTILIDPNWEVSYELTVGFDWPSGIYLIKLTAENHAQSYIPLVVRDPLDRAGILFSLPVNTYQAYNLWGGSSLYSLDKTTLLLDEETKQGKATKVSFNRPYAGSAGTGDYLSWEIHTVRWLEREGFDVTYTTNVDIDANPGSLLNYRIHISSSHDEYWTKPMRDGMEAARDHGVSLAFFGADAAYWQARLEPDHAGRPSRTLVCYKVQSNPSIPSEDLTRDPIYAQQPHLVTALWRDPAVNRPENALTGIMYSSYINYSPPKPAPSYHPDWVVSEGPLDEIMIGTGLTAGQHIPGGLLGYEYDRVWENGQTPKNLVILAASPLVNVYGNREIANTAYYRAASGAIVFDAGSIWWGWGLDESSPRGAAEPNVLKGSEPIQNLTRNILRAMLAASSQRSLHPPLPPG